MCYIYPKMKKIVSNKLRSHLTANQKDHLENNFQIPNSKFCFFVSHSLFWSKNWTNSVTITSFYGFLQLRLLLKIDTFIQGPQKIELYLILWTHIKTYSSLLPIHIWFLSFVWNFITCSWSIGLAGSGCPSNRN